MFDKRCFPCTVVYSTPNIPQSGAVFCRNLTDLSDFEKENFSNETKWKILKNLRKKRYFSSTLCATQPRTTAPFLWHCSVLATVEKPFPTHAQCACRQCERPVPRGSVHVFTQGIRKIENTFPRDSPSVPRLPPTPRYIIATKLSVTHPRFRITDQISREDVPGNSIPSFLSSSLSSLCYAPFFSRPDRIETVEIGSFD